MADIKTIQEFGNQLVIVYDDGGKRMAYPTPSGIWVVGGAKEDPGPGPNPGGPRFAWPFALNLVTSEFGQRNGRLHAGIDFGRGAANVSGSAVAASAAGTVVIANKTNNHGGYGNTVVIDHGGGLHTLYAHLRFLPGGGADVSVNVGDKVIQGQRVGGIGQTGQSQGNHLHFETHEDGYRWNASARDPRLFIPKHNA